MNDTHNLQRFIEAQATEYDQACSELRQGRKTGHWIWFIFPQLKGLGFSPTAQYFGISSLAEAEAYLQHPLLGARLIESTKLVTSIEGHSITEILGTPDDLKFKSSMTLFAHTTPTNPIFLEALNKYYGGKFDQATLDLLGFTTQRSATQT